MGTLKNRYFHQLRDPKPLIVERCCRRKPYFSKCPYIEPDPSKGGDTDNGYKSEMTKGVEVNLKPGDMLVYRGNICEHWREPFVGQDCGQVFLHYNNAATKGSKDNIFDGRPHLGLPHNFKRIKWRLMYKAMAKKSVVKTLTKRVFNHD